MRKLVAVAVIDFLLDGFCAAAEQYLVTVVTEKYDRRTVEEDGFEVRYEYDIIDAVAVRSAGGSVDVLAAQDAVTGIDDDIPTFLPVQDGNGDDSSRDESPGGGDDVLIAVLDTGIDDAHVDLDGEVTDEQDFTGTGPDDRHGHGTHVASIAAGTGDGQSRFSGVAPAAELMNVKVMDDSGSGRISDAIQGIDYAVNNGADIIVLSLGAETECDGSDPLSQAADNAVEQGVAVVVSAGNNGPDTETLTAPGCGHKVYTAGASDREETVPDFSSRGPTTDGRDKPDAVAEGTNIMAAKQGTSDGYTSKSGTSMSAPYIAGGIAVLMDEKPGKPPETYFQTTTDTAFSLGEPPTAEGAGNTNITAARTAMTDDDQDTAADNPDRDNQDSDGQNAEQDDTEQQPGNTDNNDGQTTENRETDTSVVTHVITIITDYLSALL
jgi:serine protease AprX